MSDDVIDMGSGASGQHCAGALDGRWGVPPRQGEGRVPGPHPERRDYGSFVSFSDPDGNGWLFQEVKQRRPGR